jgi:hypothetical protein
LSDFAEFLTFCAMVGVLIAFAVNVAFGLGLLKAATKRRARGLPVRYASGYGWFAATLVGSFLVVALFWLVHESTLIAERFGEPA